MPDFPLRKPTVQYDWSHVVPHPNRTNLVERCMALARTGNYEPAPDKWTRGKYLYIRASMQIELFVQPSKEEELSVAHAGGLVLRVLEFTDVSLFRQSYFLRIGPPGHRHRKFDILHYFPNGNGWEQAVKHYSDELPDFLVSKK